MGNGNNSNNINKKKKKIIDVKFFFSFQTLMYSGNNNDFDSYNIFV